MLWKAEGSAMSLVSRTQQGYGCIYSRFYDPPDGSSILDGKRGQFTQTAQQDHGERRRQRRQVGPPEPRAGTEVDQQVRQQLQPATLGGASDGSERRELTNPAQGDGRTRLNVSDVGLDGLTNLLVPVGLGIDCGGDVFSEFLDIGAQQLQKAPFLAGELVIERALGSARVANDVGDRAGAISALAYRCREAVKQA